MIQINKQRLNNWIAEGRAKGAQYVAVMYDKIDWKDPIYALYIMPYDDVQKKIDTIVKNDSYISVLKLVKLNNNDKVGDLLIFPMVYPTNIIMLD